MNQIVITQRVNVQGILQLSGPLGTEEAGRDVRITIEPIDPKQQLLPEEWRAAILSTAGGWQGEFERLPEGKLEHRELLV